MGRELKRVAPGSAWQTKDGPLLPENPPFVEGSWYQMWQTVSDKPYTPAFETPEELARWCAANPWGGERDDPVSYEAWLSFITGPIKWAPSFIDTGTEIVSGVVALAGAASGADHG